MISANISEQAGQGRAVIHDTNIEQVLQNATRILDGGSPAAEVLYRRVLQQHPNHPISHQALGLLHCHSGDLQYAAEWLAREIAANPDSAEACKNLTNIYVENDQLDNAIPRFRQVIEIPPRNLDAQYNPGATFQYRHSVDKASGVIKPDLAEDREQRRTTF